MAVVGPLRIEPCVLQLTVAYPRRPIQSRPPHTHNMNFNECRGSARTLCGMCGNPSCGVDPVFIGFAEVLFWTWGLLFAFLWVGAFTHFMACRSFAYSPQSKEKLVSDGCRSAAAWRTVSPDIVAWPRGHSPESVARRHPQQRQQR